MYGWRILSFIHLIFITSWVFLLLPSMLSAQMTPRGDVHIFWGNPCDIAVQEYGDSTYAYVTLNESDTPVAQFNVTDPTYPVYKGYLDAPLWTVSLELFEGHLYVPGEAGEVAIFDVTDPLHISRAGTITNGYGSRIVDMAIQRINWTTVHAYFEASDDALDIWDVSNIGSPFRVLRIPHSGLGGYVTLHPEGRYLYSASDSLRVYQVTPLDSIAQTSVHLTGNPEPSVFAIHPSGDVGYLAAENGVLTYDLSDRATPLFVSEFVPHSGDPDPVLGMKGDYIGAAVSDNGDYLYLAGRLGYEPWTESHDYPIDETLPVGYEPIFYAPYRDEIRAGIVKGQATTAKGGLQILSLTDSLNPSDTGYWVDNQKQTYMLKAVVHGDQVYTTDVAYGFEIFDVSAPAAPEMLGGYHCSGHSIGVHVVGDYAYVVQNLGGSLVVIDVSDKSDPQIVSTYDTGLHMWNVWSYESSYIYLTGSPGASPSHPTAGQRLHVIDISDPLNLTRVNVCIPESDLRGLRQGKYVYSADGAIYDLSDPSHPIVAGTMTRPLGGVSGLLDKVGGYVYMYAPGSTDGYLYVIDVSDIYGSAPVVVGGAQMPRKWGGRAVFDRRAGANRVYVALNELGIGVVDVSDPYNPQYLGCVTQDGSGTPLDPAKDIFCQGDRLWITAYEWYGSLSEYELSSGIDNLSLVEQVPNVGHTWLTEFVNGYAYRVAINGLDIIEVPSSAPTDVTPPSSADSLDAEWAHDHVLLTWSDPVESDFAATKIIRRTDRYPTSFDDGDQVYDGDAESFADSRIDSNTTYYYVAFSYDVYENYAGLDPGSRDSAYVPDSVPPGPVEDFRAVGLSGCAWLRWTNPSDLDHAGTRIVRRDDRYPESPDDGTIVFESGETVAYDSFLVNGETYYYSAFAYDIYDNLGEVGEGGRDFARPAPVLFQDDFEADSLGALPSRWDVRNSADTTNACYVWSDSLIPFYGSEHPLKTKALGGYHYGNIGEDGEWGWFVEGIAPLDSCTIYFDMLDPDDPGMVGEGAFVWYSVQDQENWIRLHLCPNYVRMVDVQQMVDWVSYQDWFNPCLQFGPSADWFSVRIDLGPERVLLHVNGEFRLSIENDVTTYIENEQVGQRPWKTEYAAPAGGIALGAEYGVYFDNVVITGWSGVTGVSSSPTNFRCRLHQNHPNPFNPSTIIRYELATSGHVTLRVYDVSGTLVKVLEDRDLQPGRYETGWNGENDHGESVSSGVYFYRLKADGKTLTKKMILLK
jgi:hypothetical protein